MAKTRRMIYDFHHVGKENTDRRIKTLFGELTLDMRLLLPDYIPQGLVVQHALHPEMRHTAFLPLVALLPLLATFSRVFGLCP